MINLNYFFGPKVNGKIRNGGVPPFYVSLNILDKVLHNAMFDSGASHNLMQVCDGKTGSRYHKTIQIFVLI